MIIVGEIFPFIEFVQNAALLLSLVLVFDFFILREKSRLTALRQVVVGFLIGGIGMVVMTAPWVLQPGVFFDTRSVLLSTAGLFFGFIPTVIAMALTAAFRLYLGGSGALTGVLAILASGTLGIAWRHFRRRPLAEIGWRELYLFGLLTQVLALALMFTLPWEVARHILVTASLPVLVVFPLGNLLLGILLSSRLRREDTREDLSRTTARLIATQSLTKMGGWEWDIARQSMYWTDEVYRIHGLSPETLDPGIDQSLSGYDAAGRPVIQQAFLQCAEKGLPYDMELPFTTLQGEHIWVRTMAQAVWENGRVARVVGNLMDITRRKQVELALKEIQAKYDRIMQARLRLLLFASTHSLEEVLVETLDITGELVGSPIGFFHFLDADQKTLLLQVWSTQTTRTFCQAEGKGRHYNLDEAGVWVDCVRQRRTVIHNEYAALPHRKGLPVGHAEVIRELAVPVIRGQSIVAILGVGNKASHYDEEDVSLVSTFADMAWDIAESKLAEEQIRRLNLELEGRVAKRTAELSQANFSLMQALRVKDEFLGNMSHELRTPLTGILGLAELLQAGIYGQQNDKTLKALGSIQESGQHLLTLITDILDFSRAEAETITLDLQPVWVAPVVQASLQLVQGRAFKKQVSITVELDPQVQVLQADERRLKRILVNLLDNAIKFTAEKGSIGLGVTGNWDSQQVDFSVWDTGIGIAPGDLKLQFKPFLQLDTGLGRQYEGAGLGLSLVSRLVELHGGRIEVESQLGVGSRFTVSLPWREKGNFPTGESRFQPDASDEAASASSRLPLCLVAEDSAITLEMLRDCLTACGYRVEQALDGAAALQRARELQPDLILMDIQMPVLDGLQAIRFLRQEPRFASTPIIALTALVMPGDRQRCLEAGATEYLSKPVTLAVLKRALERLGKN